MKEEIKQLLCPNCNKPISVENSDPLGGGGIEHYTCKCGAMYESDYFVSMYNHGMSWENSEIMSALEHVIDTYKREDK